MDLYLQSTETVQTLKVIQCTFGDQIADPNAANECVNQELDHIVDAWKTIETCVLDKGDALMKQNAQLASISTPKISHVPWVLINEEHNIEAEVSLVNELCGVYYPSAKPALCLPSLLDVGVYYETMDTNSASFFLNQLSQYTEYLDEIAHFSFIPYGTTKNNGGQFTCTNGDDQCHANILHVRLSFTAIQHYTIS